MLYETIDANAQLLADKFSETAPPHIFLGDTDHNNIVTTMSCVSHPNVLEALRAQGKSSLCVEISPTLIKDFLKGARDQNYFSGDTHEAGVLKAQKVAEHDPEYTKQIALELLIAQCDSFGISIEGVDAHQEHITPEEYNAIYELGVEQFTLMQKIQSKLGQTARNLGWYNNKDLRDVWRSVANKTNPENSPEDRTIIELTSMLVALTYLERKKKYSEVVESQRMKYDPEAAQLIKNKSGSNGALTIFGDGHIGIPQALGESTLHISFCPADTPLLHMSKIGDMLNDRAPDFYLNAATAQLIEGRQAQAETHAMISPYFDLDVFK